MNMTKLHTPGPWTTKAIYCNDSRSSGSDIVVASGLDQFGEPLTGMMQPYVAVVAETYPTSQSVANAKLIAAAPSTLAAMRKAYRMLVSRNSHPVISDNLAAAIHEASGPMHCNTCKSTGYVQCGGDEFEPCGGCLDGREIAEEEAKNV
jgi:hypothetical protein